MDYTPPVGGNPGDPYIDANPGIGQAGSPVPAAAIEDPQREIVNAITAAGLVPTDADLTQLAAAIVALAKLNSDVTGVVKHTCGVIAPAGYVLGAGGTIGNGSSGASERANADTEDLFTLIWDSMTDAEAPVSGGRGASAAVDFAADKTITLPDLRGRSIIGAGTGPDTAEGGGAGTARTHGAKGGVETHVQTAGELHAHSHGAGSTDGLQGGVGQSRNPNASGNQTSVTGNSDPMDWMHPWQALTPIIKL